MMLGEKRMKTIGVLASACGALLATAVAEAQTLDYGAIEALFGEPVTMSVTGAPQRESDVAATMEIITADDIRRSGARDLTGVLRHVVGLDVLQTSNDHADIGVRGYNQSFSPRLLVLVDGRQVYADYYGFTPWSAVPVELEAIRQIEVVKGPNAALFGFNAVGGVINIVTYDPLYDSVDTASLRAGTQDTVQASAVSTWRFGEAAGLLLSAGRRTNDDFSTPLVAPDVGARRGNDRTALSLDSSFELTDNLTAGLEATVSSAQHAELGPVYSLGHSEYETNSLRGQLAAETRIGLIEAMLYRNDTAADIFTAPGPTPLLSFDNDLVVAHVRSISKLEGGHTLRLSAELRDSHVPTTPVAGGDVGYHTQALGITWEWQIASQLALTTAARNDAWTLERRGDVPPGFLLTNADWDRSRDEQGFNVGVVWHIDDVDTLRFMAGRGVQLPSLTNLGGFLFPLPPVGYIGGVPDLEPTAVTNYDITWDRALATIGGGLRVSVFHGHTDEIVAALGGSRFAVGLVNTGTNVGGSVTRGFEISLEAAVGEHWRWGASFTRQDIDDDLTLPVALTFVDFENTTPEAIFLGNVGWQSGRWEIDAFLRYQSSFDGIIDYTGGAAIAALVPIDSYTTLDGRVGYAVSDRMTLSIAGQNLNRSEQQQTAAPLVERQVLAAFTVDF
jgi:outer membrane receptor for ferrienterochelin and colicins